MLLPGSNHLLHKLLGFWLQRLLYFLWLASCSAVAEVAYYPEAESLKDGRSSYPIALLEMCASDYPTFSFQPGNITAPQSRNILLLASDRVIDVMWTVSTQERETQLQAIPIPIDRGLIGWRLLLIQESQQHLFNTIKTTEDLRHLIAGQGHDWPDTETLKANQLAVTTSTRYEGLFRMLEQQHIDYFPRSISEIWTEQKSHADQSLIVEKNLALHYPAMLYFFVNRENSALANMLTECLHTATKDGRLKNIFYGYYRKAIEQANLTNRKILNLELSDSQPKPPNLPPVYWFKPGESE